MVNLSIVLRHYDDNFVGGKSGHQDTALADIQSLRILGIPPMGSKHNTKDFHRVCIKQQRLGLCFIGSTYTPTLRPSCFIKESFKWKSTFTSYPQRLSLRSNPKSRVNINRKGRCTLCKGNCGQNNHHFHHKRAKHKHPRKKKKINKKTFTSSIQ